MCLSVAHWYHRVKKYNFFYSAGEFSDNLGAFTELWIKEKKQIYR